MIDCQPDFGRTAADYARHRAGFPVELIDRLRAQGIARKRARVVDLGTGTDGPLNADGVLACSHELTDMLEEGFVEDPLTIQHRVWAVTAKAPPS